MANSEIVRAFQKGLNTFTDIELGYLSDIIHFEMMDRDQVGKEILEEDARMDEDATDEELEDILRSEERDFDTDGEETDC